LYNKITSKKKKGGAKTMGIKKENILKNKKKKLFKKH